MRALVFPVALGLSAGLVAYVIFELAPAIGFTAELLRAGAYSPAMSLLGATLMAGTSLATATLAALIALNTGLIAHYVRQRRSAPSSGIVGGIAGAVAALFGIGCAACGSTLAIALFGAGSGTIVSALPYGGIWLGDAGMVILVLSAAFLVREIKKPLVCAI